MSNLNEAEAITYVDAPDSSGSARRKVFIVILVAVIAIIVVGFFVNTKTHWVSGGDKEAAVELPILVCNSDTCSEPVPPVNEGALLHDFNSPSPCAGPNAALEDCFPAFEQVTPPEPIVSTTERLQMDELNAAIDAQLTSATKMNHLFIQYCGVQQESMYSVDYPTEYGTQANGGHNDTQYDVLAEKLYEQFRADLIASDETNEALINLPSSFDSASDVFC